MQPQNIIHDEQNRGVLIDQDYIIDDNCPHSMNSLMGLENQHFDEESFQNHEKIVFGTRKQSLVPQIKEQPYGDHLLESQRVMCEKYQNKLIRNRESAKNSRKRKKIYIELLEEKVKKLTQIHEIYMRTNEGCQNVLSEMRQKLSQSQEQNNQKVLLLSTIHNAVLSQSGEQKINSILQAYNKRFGTANPERIQRVEHFSQEINSNSLENYEKYLLSCAKYERDIFGNHEDQFNVLQRLNLSTKQKEMLQKSKQKLQNSFDQIVNSMNEISETGSLIQKELNNLDQTVKFINGELFPSHISKFLIECEQIDTKSEFKQIFDSNFGNDNSPDEISLDIYQFMKEFKLIDSLEINVKQTKELYQSARDAISKKLLKELKKD